MGEHQTTGFVRILPEPEAFGGRKDDTGKLRYDLIPIEPMRKVAEVYTIGAKKYEDRNWEKGIKWGRIYAAMQRHLTSWWNGEQNDPIDGQHHLASVVWGALALMEFEKTHRDLDDRPSNGKPSSRDTWRYHKDRLKAALDSPHQALAIAAAREVMTLLETGL